MIKSKKIKLIIIISAVVIILALCATGIYIFRDILFEKDAVEQAIENGDITIHFIDVGQADCVLIMTPQGNMLVDSGTSSSEGKLENYLTDLDITSFEYLVITHPHDDHIGGADMIIRNFDVRNIMMSDMGNEEELANEIVSLASQYEINVIYPDSGYNFSLGECQNTVIAPNSEYDEYDEVNSTSIVLKCQIDKRSVILTGDAEADSEAEMIAKYGNFLDCDILKLGHHGSKTSSSYRFLEITSPEYAIACCGEDNTYGHPAAEVKYRLNMFGITLLSTDKEGSIVFSCDGDTFEYIG
ncbi:MAG: MBL fold metallo-hydrolase [Ruminococcaceae bacterium]|nr:MBL fold metallo-hydrolase [Oscillospiraceae bacterium]